MRRHPIATAHHRRCRWGFHHFGEIHDGPIIVDGNAMPAQTCLRCGVISATTPILAGTSFTWLTGFTVAPNGTPTNPTTVTYVYKPGSSPEVTLTELSGSVTVTVTGTFSAVISTTGLPGNWILQAVGTGTCEVTAAIALTVAPTPL